jgi:hypothetical protein
LKDSLLHIGISLIDKLQMEQRRVYIQWARGFEWKPTVEQHHCSKQELVDHFEVVFRDCRAMAN